MEASKFVLDSFSTVISQPSQLTKKIITELDIKQENVKRNLKNPNLVNYLTNLITTKNNQFLQDDNPSMETSNHEGH